MKNTCPHHIKAETENLDRHCGGALLTGRCGQIISVAWKPDALRIRTWRATPTQRSRLLLGEPRTSCTERLPKFIQQGQHPMIRHDIFLTKSRLASRHCHTLGTDPQIQPPPPNIVSNPSGEGIMHAPCAVNVEWYCA